MDLQILCLNRPPRRLPILHIRLLRRIRASQEEVRKSSLVVAEATQHMEARASQLRLHRRPQHLRLRAMVRATDRTQWFLEIRLEDLPIA